MFWFTVQGGLQFPIVMPVTVAHSLCSENGAVLLSWGSTVSVDMYDNNTTSIGWNCHDMRA